MFRSKKKWQVLVDKLYPADVNAGINSYEQANAFSPPSPPACCSSHYYAPALR